MQATILVYFLCLTILLDHFQILFSLETDNQNNANQSGEPEFKLFFFFLMWDQLNRDSRIRSTDNIAFGKLSELKNVKSLDTATVSLLSATKANVVEIMQWLSLTLQTCKLSFISP